MPQRTRRVVPATTALLVLLATVTGCGGGDERAEVRTAAAAFLSAWSAGDHERAARRSDAPQDTLSALDAAQDRLSVRKVSAQLDRVAEPADGRATARYRVTLSLVGLGEWAYSSRLRLRQVGSGDDQRWVVHWSPAVIHPRLTARTALSRVRELPERAPILDRDGQPLMSERPVVDVGIEPRRLTRPEQAYALLARLDVDPDQLAARVEAAEPDHFVPVITLRREDFARQEDQLRSVPGLVFRDATRTLAPSPTYGRALLGTVRPATKESLEQAGPLASTADQLGASGLQLAFQSRLAGRPGGEVRLVRTADRSVLAVLHRFESRPGRALETTLDRRVQAGAERALARADRPAALVALRPSTGEVLAAASAPADSAFNRAFVGRYPPGSTFKVVSAAALLGDGLRPTDEVGCPESVTVEGKRFGNYDDLGALGQVPFARDFTMSCNTAFIGATRDLPRSALAETARLFGVGREWDLGVSAFSGSVPPAKSAVEQAASSIGQGRVVMSPLAMATVAAAVADGTPRPPVLLPERAAGTGSPPPLPGGVARTLRELMRQTVDGGTARVLALPGEPVGGKTGTAEYGTASPPRTHAWMIGFRGDLAFAVLVEDGESGSKTAGPIARTFLSGL